MLAHASSHACAYTYIYSNTHALTQQGDVLTCSDSPTHEDAPTNAYTNTYTHAPCDTKLATHFLEGSDGQTKIFGCIFLFYFQREGESESERVEESVKQREGEKLFVAERRMGHPQIFDIIQENKYMLKATSEGGGENQRGLSCACVCARSVFVT